MNEPPNMMEVYRENFCWTVKKIGLNLEEMTNNPVEIHVLKKGCQTGINWISLDFSKLGKKNKRTS